MVTQYFLVFNTDLMSYFKVVIKMHKGLEEVDIVKPWLSNIYARAPGCPVIIVGTHYDKVHKSKRQEVVHQFVEKLNELKANPGIFVLSQIVSSCLHNFCSFVGCEAIHHLNLSKLSK